MRASPSSSFQEPMHLVAPQSISAHPVSSASCENMLVSVCKDIAISLYATCAVASSFFSADLPRFSGHCEAQCDPPQKTPFRSSLPLLRLGCDCCWGKKPRAIGTWCCFALASRSVLLTVASDVKAWTSFLELWPTHLDHPRCSQALPYLLSSGPPLHWLHLPEYCCTSQLRKSLIWPAASQGGNISPIFQKGTGTKK